MLLQTFVHQEHIIELKQWGEIFEQCVVDLIQPIEESIMLFTAEKEDFPLLGGEKVQLKCNKSEGTPVFKCEFDTMVLSVNRDKVEWFATLISHIEFVIPNEFNDAEYKISLFLVLPKMIQELVQVSWAKVCIFQHFKAPGQIFSSRGEWYENHNEKIILF